MTPFHYQNDELFAEDLPLSRIADQFGTPCYVYSRAALEDNLRAYEQALGDIPHLTCFAVKANSNLAVLNILARAGAGFDIVSGGELARVLRAGGQASKVIFSGLGKTEAEIEQALKAGILCFNVESEPELERINAVAGRLSMRAPISLRVNPDVDAGTHPYISTGLKENKFGIDIAQALNVYKHAATLPNIHVTGVDCHIGSQLTSIAPYLDAIDRVLMLIDQLSEHGIELQHFDIGGGLGVVYQDEQPPAPHELIDAVKARLADRKLELIVEPGRSIAANAGILLTRVEFLKHTDHKHFAIVDGAMNDLLRPALYGAWQAIEPVKLKLAGQHTGHAYDIVGPVCESGDFLGKDRWLEIAPGDLLAVRSAGAYGFVMSSNYNTRNRAAEVMVDGNQATVVRKRETIDYQLSLESTLSD
ncbi:diaminopimelate decarboxylase [Pseudohongiella spirulinae]|uniref:Diaminopimelate decarboxylase n=1 Tax=Pseudohongiella spirulinae TaxID=1249552 RepID=A0A0S2K9S9_9GAMM|nr:diaminopimelate decarboxylase [Pseudohongiella spirulinae]ALO45110.1 Diaminopimelate decarboxylase [Pseudohongiella spirulinae]